MKSGDSTKKTDDNEINQKLLNAYLKMSEI
jgi:hypothetical protein